MRTEVSSFAEHQPDWWHRDHPTFTPIMGFFSGVIFVALVPAGFIAALRAFFSFVADREPTAIAQCAEILHIPTKMAPVHAPCYLELEEVKAILARDVTQRDARTVHDGASPLMFAAMLGHLDIVQLLVHCGCEINGQDAISGWTALMQATFHG